MDQHELQLNTISQYSRSMDLLEAQLTEDIHKTTHYN